MQTRWNLPTSNQTPPPRPLYSPGIFRVPATSVSCVGHPDLYPDLCKLCAPVPQIPRVTGTAFSYVRARNFCKLCTPVPQHPEAQEFLEDFRTRTRSFWELCKTPIPLPGVHKPYRTYPSNMSPLLLSSNSSNRRSSINSNQGAYRKTSTNQHIHGIIP